MTALILLVAVWGGYLAVEHDKGQTEQRRCILEVTDLDMYGDLCAESSSGYERMKGRAAHFDGAACMADSVRECLR